MNGKQVKLVRGQVRQAVQDELPGVMSQEMIKDLETRIMERLEARLNGIAASIKETLDAIDARSKEVAGYVVRNTTTSEAPVAEAPLPPAASDA